MSIDELDPEIVAARLKQAASVHAVDFTTLPWAEGRVAANAAAMFFSDEVPVLPVVENLSIRPAGSPPIPARIYCPDTGSKGAVLYVHGGGWFHCNVDTHDRLMRLLALRSGLTVLGIDYRLAPEHPFPAALNDTRSAWLWLRANSSSLGAEPEKLAIAGDSAGANLGLATALTLRDSGETMPAALALFYGCFAPEFDTESHRRLGDGRFGLTTARMRWYWQNYVAGDLSATQLLAAPLRADLVGLPRTYLSLAELDPLSDDTRALSEKLSAAVVQHELVAWPRAGHGFMQMTRDVAVAREAVGHAASFLSAALA
jgi:acetyl esterase